MRAGSSAYVPSDPLRVAVLAPISWRVPPRHYGPWELFASLLTEGLVARGVDTTLFATADSVTSARLVGVAPTGYSEDPSLDAKVWEALHIAAVFERASEFDIIHNSFDFLPLTYTRLVNTPDRDHDSRVWLGRNTSRLPAVLPIVFTTLRSAMPTVIPLSRTRRPSTTASTSRHSTSDRVVRRWSSSGGSIPTKGRLPPSKLPPGRGFAL